ncbi:MAG: hypothetical protein M1812_000803 [Candelaria pacifica]|nr:MAG: hypothetical protein M1812_000803 [Candelaria pacifica]
MLGRLLHTAASSLSPSGSSSPRSPTEIESVTEETHTRNLLFPDASLLNQSQDHAFPLSNAPLSLGPAASSTFDDKGDITLDSSRDIRVIIAQDATSSQGKMVLFDSRPILPRSPPAKQAPTLVPEDGKKSGKVLPMSPSEPDNGKAGVAIARPAYMQRSASTLQDAPTPNPQPQALFGQQVQPKTQSALCGGAFQRARMRGASIPSGPSLGESTQARLVREGEEETRTLLDCMFGSAVLSYKGPSTKLHVLPSEGPSTIDNSPVIGEGFGSFGRADMRKRSQLAQSFTPSNPPPELIAPTTSSPIEAMKENKITVLVTRLFSVELPDENSMAADTEEHTPTPQNSLGSTHSFPFPHMERGSGVPKHQQPKTRKTPMFSVGVVVQLPAPAGFPLVPPSRSGHRSKTSFSSSFDSERKSGWTFLDSGYGVDSLTSSAIASDFDDGVDSIVQRWDVITRALSSLQAMAQEKIQSLLQKNDSTSPNPLQPPSSPTPALRLRNGHQPLIAASKPKLSTNVHSVQLVAGALSTDDAVKRVATKAAVRVAIGIRTPRVLTGQGRWGVWREEARWVGRWAGGKEQNFFFFNLLTAFLGNHTEWLNSIGPHRHRRRRQQQTSKASFMEDAGITSRTIIISDNKMAARRLIFLLSAFLPATHRSHDILSPQRPGSSASIRGYSRSPPTSVLVNRQQSLRRTINKRGNASRGGKSLRGHSRAVSLSSQDGQRSGTEDDTCPIQDAQHVRRSSDVRSIKTASLPIPSGGGDTRKSSATTTATPTPDATVSVAHFASRRDPSSPGTAAEPRPGSSGSLASLNLMHTLKRNDSNNISTDSPDSQPASRWGSLISGFWSNRRDSSTEGTETMPSSDDGLGISGVQTSKPLVPRLNQNKLEQMAAEVSSPDDSVLHQADADSQVAGIIEISLNTGQAEGDSQLNTPRQEAPEQALSFTSPLKLSIDAKDGVIDVELPAQDFAPSSFGSGTSFPNTSGFLSASSLDKASSYGHSSSCSFSHVDPDATANVAGWLKRFHEDFALQSVRPHEDMEKDIKRSMRDEPTPALAPTTPQVEGGPADRWVDVCTTLIADTRTFSVRRLRLRRRVKLPPAEPKPAAITAPRFITKDDSLTTYQYGNPYTLAQLTPGNEKPQPHLEEKFIEEPIMDMDGTLVDAIERVLAQSGHSSRAHSAASSRSSSRRGRPDHNTPRNEPISIPNLEIPRGECKKMVLGALEQVVRSVRKERFRDEGVEGVVVDSTLREGVRRWLDDVEFPR